MLARPHDGAPRFRIEVLHIHAAQGSPVVIADDGHGAKVADAPDALVRLGSVANGVAQAPDRIVIALRVLEHGLEGGQVCMNIGQNQDAHRHIDSCGRFGA